MSQQMTRDVGAKRKVGELNDEPDSQTSAEKTDENLTKKIKSPDEEAANSSNDATAQSNLPVRADQEIILATGIYRVQCPELGDFHIRAGATGSFCVKAATLKISNSEGTIFPDPATTLIDGAEVEVEDNLSGTTKLTVLPVRAKPPPQNQSWLTTISDVILGFSAATPLQIIGLVDSEITITGRRSAVITGNGGRVTLLGSGEVTVEGSIQSLKNNGNGTVKVIGKVTEEVRQTGSGSILITEDVIGNISNSGGGCIEVRGKHTGTNKQMNNSNGSVKIGSGPNNGGVREHYYTKNYKIIQI